MTSSGPLEHVQQNNEVCAVVSTFNPGPETVENIDWLFRYVSRVVVVDDGSSRDVQSTLAALEALGAAVIRLETNSGIAAALNTGIREARNRWHPEWVVTMDQDSRFSGDYVNAALATVRSSPHPESVGMVCAESHNGVLLPALGGTSEPEVFDPMTSGSLVRCGVFDEVGYFDEEFFIDCVDTEFNARLRDRGLRSLAGHGCNLVHSLGNARPMMILGWRVRIGQKKLNVYYHPPFRVYYITRNSLVMAHRFWAKQPGWVLRRMYMEVQSHIVRFLYGPDRRKHLIAATAGARDARRGRLGKIDEALASRLR
ncbi:glycosyltransferase [Pseudarthrobacter sp. alpha12b]